MKKKTFFMRYIVMFTRGNLTLIKGLKNKPIKSSKQK